MGRAAPALLGRRNAVRLARHILDAARLDGANRIADNGELLVQVAVLDNWRRDPISVLDVGAHYGEWSTFLLERAQTQGRRVDLHGFEPTSYSFAQLESALRGWDDHQISLNRQAASSTPGTATIHKPHEGAGSSSVHPLLSRTNQSTEEEIELIRIDDYCEAVALQHVALLKVDAEGHDMEVLRGARRSLEDGRIALVQFEYNHRWISSRSYLRDAFALLTPLGFRIGKVTNRGIELYDEWHPELETFREGNYVGLSPVSVAWMPTITWWNS